MISRLHPDCSLPKLAYQIVKLSYFISLTSKEHAQYQWKLISDQKIKVTEIKFSGVLFCFVLLLFFVVENKSKRKKGHSGHIMQKFIAEITSIVQKHLEINKKMRPSISKHHSVQKRYFASKFHFQNSFLKIILQSSVTWNELIWKNLTEKVNIFSNIDFLLQDKKTLIPHLKEMKASFLKN